MEEADLVFLSGEGIERLNGFQCSTKPARAIGNTEDTTGPATMRRCYVEENNCAVRRSSRIIDADPSRADVVVADIFGCSGATVVERLKTTIWKNVLTQYDACCRSG